MSSDPVQSSATVAVGGADAPRRRKWLLRLVKVLVVVLLTWGVSSTIRSAIDELGRSRPTLHPWWLVAAGLLYFAGMLPCGFFWHRALRAMGQTVSLAETIRAYHIGHLGKYVPGKAMVVVVRAGLIKRDSLDTRVVAASVFLETLTMMSVGAFLAAAILLLILPQHGLLLAIAIVLMVGSGLPTLPPIYRRLVRLVLGKNVDRASALDGVTYPLMGGGWVVIAIGWFILGLSLWATLRSLGAGSANPLEDLLTCTASVALAVVAGFLSLIPGGAVVRELVLTELLGSPYGEATALVAAVLLRLIWLVSELLFSVILYVGIRPQRNS